MLWCKKHNWKMKVIIDVFVANQKRRGSLLMLTMDEGRFHAEWDSLAQFCSCCFNSQQARINKHALRHYPMEDLGQNWKAWLLKSHFQRHIGHKGKVLSMNITEMESECLNYSRMLWSMFREPNEQMEFEVIHYVCTYFFRAFLITVALAIINLHILTFSWSL